eukprot:2758607-Prymnesium_polylepis.1
MVPMMVPTTTHGLRHLVSRGAACSLLQENRVLAPIPPASRGLLRPRPRRLRAEARRRKHMERVGRRRRPALSAAAPRPPPAATSPCLPATGLRSTPAQARPRADPFQPWNQSRGPRSQAAVWRRRSSHALRGSFAPECSLGRRREHAVHRTHLGRYPARVCQLYPRVGGAARHGPPKSLQLLDVTACGAVQPPRQWTRLPPLWPNVELFMAQQEPHRRRNWRCRTSRVQLRAEHGLGSSEVGRIGEGLHRSGLLLALQSHDDACHHTSQFVQ